MTKTKYWLSLLAISVVLVAGSLAVSPIAIAGDDEDDDEEDDEDDNGGGGSQGISCSNQRAIGNHISTFIADDECIIGTDLGLSLDGPSTAGTHIYTVTIINNGPNDYIDGAFVQLAANDGMIEEPFPDFCEQSFIFFVDCFFPPIETNEEFVFEIEIQTKTNPDPGFSLVIGQLLGDRFPNPRVPVNDDDDQARIFFQPP